MVSSTAKGPTRPTGLMKAARHCERPAEHLGGHGREAGRGLSHKGKNAHIREGKH